MYYGYWSIWANIRSIDPLRLGENYRALQVALMYGQRLSTNNVKPDTIDNLISSFPSHGFVIDRVEASGLFRDVREPSATQQQLCDHLRSTAQEALFGQEPFVYHLTGEGDPFESEEKEEKGNDDQPEEENAETPTLA